MAWHDTRPRWWGLPRCAPRRASGAPPDIYEGIFMKPSKLQRALATTPESRSAHEVASYSAHF